MAHMNIHIEMDNAAFDMDSGVELARILHDLAERMAMGVYRVTHIRDENGNRIGQAEYYEEN